MAKTPEVDVNQEDMIEEVHERLDALLKLLEKKGLIAEAEYVNELNKLIDSKE